jgi:hypothetical protein
VEIVLGAAVALLGAVIGTIALEWLTGRRLERHFARERFQKFRGLPAEMAENSVLDTGGGWRKAPSSTDAWEEAKGILAELEPEVEDVIRQAYVRVRVRNALVDYDRASMESGRASLDADIRKSASRVVDAMRAALQALDARIQEGKR